MDSFVFKAHDGISESEPALITITVTPNTPPMAHAQQISTRERTAADVTLAGSDADGGQLYLYVTEAPRNGVLGGAYPNLIYYPNAGFSGVDSFVFKAHDGISESEPALITITVTPNGAPVANDLNISTEKNTPVAVTLSGTDPEGDPVSVFVATLPQHGALSGTYPNLTYSPKRNYRGADAFSFYVVDFFGAYDVGTVAISVGAL